MKDKTLIYIVGIASIVAILAAYTVHSLNRPRIAHSGQTQGNPVPDTIIGQVERIQRALKATGIPRYDPCEIDDIPGGHFRRAYTNYSNDEKYRKIIKKMERKPDEKM